MKLSNLSRHGAAVESRFARRVSQLGPLLLALPLALGFASAARAQVSLSVGIESPGLSIGLSVPGYPNLVRVPGYPVYYAPQLGANYFFHDGLFWVYQYERWYASAWYNGPWRLVEPVQVPLYILRVPVRYYHRPPSYFHGWQREAPPHWGQHWGRHWEEQRRGWDKWDRHTVPAAAPLPSYQKKYRGDRYPHEAERQQTIRSANYAYRSRGEAGQREERAQGQGERPESPPPRQQSRAEPSGKDHGNKSKSPGHSSGKKKD